MAERLIVRLVRAVIAAPIMFYIVYFILKAIGINQLYSTSTAFIVAVWIFYTLARYDREEALKRLA